MDFEHEFFDDFDWQLQQPALWMKAYCWIMFEKVVLNIYSSSTIILAIRNNDDIESAQTFCRTSISQRHNKKEATNLSYR